MNELNKIPKGTQKIIALTILIPIITSLSNELNKKLTLRLNWLLPLNLLVGLFKSSINANLFISTLMRLQTLTSIERSGITELELIFYTLFSCPMFLVAWYLEGITTFCGSLTLMYIVYLSKLNQYFNVFGVVVKGEYLPFINLLIEFVTSKGMTKSYYGYINGVLYFYLKSRGMSVPYWFNKFYNRFKLWCVNLVKVNKSVRLRDARKKRK